MEMTVGDEKQLASKTTARVTQNVVPPNVRSGVFVVGSQRTQ